MRFIRSKEKETLASASLMLLYYHMHEICPNLITNNLDLANKILIGALSQIVEAIRISLLLTATPEERF